MRAKTWLVEKGHLETDGRGRMPLRVLPILEEARKSGVVFSDWPKGKVTVAEESGAVSVKRDSNMSHEKIIHAIPDYRYPLDAFKAYEFVDGKRKPVSLKECCNTCRVSLVVHRCDNPTYLNNRKVFIEPVRK